jgi:hypothetical protein
MLLSDKEHQIVREGNAAASLLANDDFQTIVKALILEGYSTFTETKPHEAESREHIYNLVQALKAIESELTARVHAKDEIERKVNEGDADDEDLIDDAELGVNPNI